MNHLSSITIRSSEVPTYPSNIICKATPEILDSIIINIKNHENLLKTDDDVWLTCIILAGMFCSTVLFICFQSGLLHAQIWIHYGNIDNV
ncbi:hypothetical protein EPI10_019513 [Gossypium australe]|uniref:Uncharacterized protein n=1 Tax=Gossypium australe TaxID=47621 RepID=A0A5B6WB10_9ROSI|nr:hypothetical protein EPI10_019513 [Gossypium australe]